jgi:NADH-quinone oxidoreductase subunit M
MARFSISWMLVAEAMRLALFASTEPWELIGLLVLTTLPPYIELVRRGKSTRVYVLHMALFVGLLVTGWAFADAGGDGLSTAAAVLLLAAILVRSGTVPVHLWVADLVENGSFGTAVLYLTPIAGVYAAVRLVLPTAPDWALQVISVFSLVTAVYSAGLAVVQKEARRFFAYLFLSHASLVLVGLELRTSMSLTGALCLWVSVALSLGGLGLTLRAVEARFGRLTFDQYRGLYEHSPALAVCFLLTGLGSVGFPGTLGYVAAELMVDGAIEANPWVGVVMTLTAALNGIAIVRVYFLLFTGGRHVSAIPLGISPRERIAVFTLAALILGGGLFPQPGVISRHKAAEDILQTRKPAPAEHPHPAEHSEAGAGK